MPCSPSEKGHMPIKTDLKRTLIKVKRQAHIEYQHGQSSSSLNRLREVKKVEGLQANALTIFG